MLDLPARHPNFVGRATELGRLEEAFERTNLLALEGQAGSGKTSLALELANRRLKQHPDIPILWLRARGGWSVEVEISVRSDVEAAGAA